MDLGVRQETKEWGKYPQQKRVHPNFELIRTKNQESYVIESINSVIAIKHEIIITI